MNLNSLIAAHGGVLRISVLLGWGVPKHLIRAAIDRGELFRPRRGWISTFAAKPSIVAAVAAGGRLACVSAAAHHGLWVPYSVQPHVAFPAHSGHASSSNVVAHWDSERWMDAAAPVETVLESLAHVISCLEHEQAVAVVDSALHSGQVSMLELEALALGIRESTVLADCDQRSESGHETYVRLRFRRSGYPVRTQVEIPGVGRVDLLVGDRLVIEVDSRDWHDSEDAFLTDRSRDLALMRAGYLVVRIATHHIDHEWQWVEQVMRSLLARNEHRWAVRHVNGTTGRA